MIREKDFENFLAGKENAFKKIFHQYYKTLVSYAMRFGLVDTEAEDIVIEVLHQIWTIRQDVKSPAALHTLLYTSVKNRALNTIRNIRNRNRIIENREPEPEEEHPYERLMEEEMSRILYDAISTLPTRSRTVILSLLGGKSISEIAEEMAISVNSVKTYRQRAIFALQKLLKDYPIILAFILLKIELF